MYREGLNSTLSQQGSVKLFEAIEFKPLKTLMSVKIRLVNRAAGILLVVMLAIAIRDTFSPINRHVSLCHH